MNFKSPRGQVHSVEEVRVGGFVTASCGSTGNIVIEQRIRYWDPSSRWRKTDDAVSCKNCIRVISTDAKASTL